MTARCWSAPVLAALLLSPPATPLAPAEEKAPEPTARQRQMAEDVEILGRLLQPAFTPALVAPGPRQDALTFQYPGAGPAGPFRNWAGWVDTDVHAGLKSPSAEGVYLKGTGVVYSVTLLPPATDPLRGPATTVGKPLTAWEKARKELHGDPVGGGTEGKQAAQPGLAAEILQVLADNGHHLQLADDERVVVAVTFRGAADACVRCHGGPGSGIRAGAGGGRVSGTDTPVPEALPPQPPPPPGTPGGAPGGYDPAKPGSGPGLPGLAPTPAPAFGRGFGQPGAGGPPPSYTVPPGVTPPAPVAPPPTEAPSGEAANYLSLGDLHFKQGKYAEAARAYRQAADLLMRRSDPRVPGEKPAEEDVATLWLLAEVHTKVARACLAARDEEGARLAGRQSLQYAQAAEKAAERLREARTAAVPLPAKLVVSVSKKALDQAAAGKLSAEEFRKAASVEYLTFGPRPSSPKTEPKPDPKPAPPLSTAPEKP